MAAPDDVLTSDILRALDQYMKLINHRPASAEEDDDERDIDAEALALARAHPIGALAYPRDVIERRTEQLLDDGVCLVPVGDFRTVGELTDAARALLADADADPPR
ncbi:MAG TPA: hypothetical protein VIL49_07380 [Capillimicrobium sp.]|jgi:hypothetical protein